MRTQDLLATLPAEWPEAELRAKITVATRASGRRVVVLDDDPTGTQTVHSLPVLTEWTVEALASAWAEAETTFYILTDSRRYPLAEAAAMNREIARNLAQVARRHGVEPAVPPAPICSLREYVACRGCQLVEQYPRNHSGWRFASEMEGDLDSGYEPVSTRRQQATISARGI